MNKLQVLLYTAAFGTILLSGCLGGGNLFVTATSATVASENDQIMISVATPEEDASEVDIKITYNDENVYEGVVYTEDFEGTAFLKLNQFCIGNGVYSLEAKLNKKTAITTFSVEKWIDYIQVTTTKPIYNMTEDENVSLYVTPRGLGNFVVISGNGSVIISKTFEESESLNVSVIDFSLSMQYSTSLNIPIDSLMGEGTYAITSVEFDNDWAKDNSVTDIHPESTIEFTIES